MGVRRDSPITEHVRSHAAAGDDGVAGARGTRRDRATMSDDGREPDSRTVSRQ